VLIAADVPDPSNLAHEGRRILFTLDGGAPQTPQASTT
jgi:hypothetical protein